MVRRSPGLPTRVMLILSPQRVLLVPLLVAVVGCTAAPPPPAAPASAAATPSPESSSPTPAAPTAPPATAGTPTASATGAPPSATGQPPATPPRVDVTPQPPATPPGVDVTPQPAADLPSALVFARAKVGSLPSSMAWAGGRLWLGDGFGVAELDPATGTIVRRLDFGPLATVEALEDADVLVAVSNLEETIAIVDPATGELSSSTDVPCPAEFAPVSESEAWVTNPCADTVSRVTLGSGVTDTVRISRPRAIALGGGAIWVTGDTNVVRIDPETLAKRHVLPPGFGVATDLEYLDGPAGAAGLWVNSVIDVFVTSSSRGALTRIDPETLQAESIDAGSTALLRLPESLEVHDGDVWTVGVEPLGFRFEVPRVLTRVDTESKRVVDELVVLNGSVVLSGGTEPDSLWLARPMDEVFGVRATEGGELPPPAESTEGGMTLETVTYAGGMPDHVYQPAGEASLPTFVLVGGGAVPPSEVHHMSNLATGLAANGAVVHVVGFRSETTGGTFDDMVADARCAVAYARSTASDFGGSEQVVLVGFSYGADAVLTAVTTDGPASPDCAATGETAPDALVALDGFRPAAIATGEDVPMLFVGALLGGNHLEGRQLATRLRDEGYAIESVELGLEHGGMMDASPTAGVVSAMLDFATRLGD